MKVRRFNAAVTPERLKELLSYDPETGVFIWLDTSLAGGHGRMRGKVAGTVNGCGYPTIMVDGKRYFASRLAYLYMLGKWPPSEIDHINRVRADTRWSNLRPCWPSQNKVNRRLSSRNTSGYCGVSWRSRDNCWWAAVTIGGKKRHIGLFKTKEEAYNAYLAVATKIHGSFIPKDTPY